MNNRFFRTFVFLLLLPASVVFGQSVQYITPKQGTIAYQPKGFYIQDVVDDRQPVGPIGNISNGTKKEPIDFTNGAAAYLKALLGPMVKYKSAAPVRIHITTLSANATRKGSGWVATAHAALTFYAGNNKLVEYTNKGSAQTDSDPRTYIEGFVKQALEGDLKKFELWWLANRGEVATSNEVKTVVALAKTIDKPSGMVYSLQRLLQISDFTGKPRGKDQEMAATYSGIGMGFAAQTRGGHLVINVTITPYFDREESWFKEEGKNAHVLLHEQIHFDITAIKACELMAEVRNASLTQENYREVINRLQQENGQASNAMQDAYDSETNHGLILEKQAAWVSKIREQVKTCGCY